MKRAVFLIIMLLSFIIACDPSYKTEMPDLNKDWYDDLSLEEKFEVFKKVSGYIDTPDYVEDGIAKEGKNAVPLVLNYIDSLHPSTKKIDAIYLLAQINKYYNIKGTEVEKFLEQKIMIEKDKDILASYKSILESIQAVETSQKIFLLAPAFGDNPAIYTDDESIIKYVELVKDTIMQETGMSLEELNNRFNIVGYVKGERFMGRFPTQDIDNKTLAISFVANVDWIDVRDYLEFAFLDVEGNEISLEKIKQEVKVPFYLKINKLKSRVEIEAVLKKTNLNLKIITYSEPEHYQVILDYINKKIYAGVSGIINEKNNQCILGKVDLITGNLSLNNVACIVY